MVYACEVIFFFIRLSPSLCHRLAGRGAGTRNTSYSRKMGRDILPERIEQQIFYLSKLTVPCCDLLAVHGQ